MAKTQEEIGVPTIIAMKGHPGTGKSTLAQSIASHLRIPLIDKDDIRDCTLQIQRTLVQGSASPALLNDLSYDIIWQIASTQLRLGLSLVIDSPLSRRVHLDRLMQLVAVHNARLLIIECKPKDEGEWRRRLERRGEGDGRSWHKPATWEDLEKLLEGYGGCTDYDVGGVPRMVVDTTASVGLQELCSGVIEFVVSLGGPSTLINHK